MDNLKLFMIMVGCRPKGRHTEQHDILFGIASSMKELVPVMLQFWPEAKGNMHVDAWRTVTYVDGYTITVIEKDESSDYRNNQQLFFINLGGYKKGEFDEFHYKMLTIAGSKEEAIKKAKLTAFYKHTGFKGAPSHIDDKFGVDVDDIFEIKEILPAEVKAKYQIIISDNSPGSEDELHLGYFKLDKL